MMFHKKCLLRPHPRKSRLRTSQNLLRHNLFLDRELPWFNNPLHLLNNKKSICSI
jgi:hypothetical protein